MNTKTFSLSRRFFIPIDFKAIPRYSTSPSASAFAGSNKQKYLAHFFTSCSVLSFCKRKSQTTHFKFGLYLQSHPLKHCISYTMPDYYKTIVFGPQQYSEQNYKQNLCSCTLYQDPLYVSLLIHGLQERYVYVLLQEPCWYGTFLDMLCHGWIHWWWKKTLSYGTVASNWFVLTLGLIPTKNIMANLCCSLFAWSMVLLIL